MARVKRAVNAHKKRRASSSGQRLPRPALAPVPQGQGAGHPLPGLQLQRPQEAQGRLPPAVDPAHQRRCPRQRHDVQPLHPGSEPAAVIVDRKILADLAVNDATAFAALVEVARAAVAAEGIGGAAASSLRPPDLLSTITPGSRRPVGSLAGRPAAPPGSFLPRAPQAVREAQRAPDVVIEVFATADALRRAVRPSSWPGSESTRSARPPRPTLSETVTPQGLVAVCRRVDVPLATGARPAAEARGCPGRAR